ncbi:MAG TPA: PEP-CTERM sorting domain-containing protein [Gammaproteobacteria bacterium]|nr:PEP-CTERM sorting domain-containing protein [Gammaproteobacteria bacterium]
MKPERARSELKRVAASVLGAVAYCVSCAAGAVPITIDGAGDTIGALPWVAFGAWEGTDGYPLGPGFNVTPLGLFDTGATSVAIPQIQVGFLSSGTGFQNPVDLRINGLQQIDATFDGPWGSSSGVGEGGAVPADLEVLGVNVNVVPDAAIPPTPLPGTPFGVIPSLLGAPVANQSIALIDYTSPASVPLFGGTVEGVAIDFFDVGEAPATELQLSLSRFGSTDPVGGSDRGERYNLHGVTFRNGSGAASGSYFYDTGTTITLINNSIAQLLGISTGVTPSFECDSGRENVQAIGVQVDSFVVTGIGGDYTVNNAELCWAQTDIPFTDSHAIIGSNLFSQVPILFDGINNTLGIGIAAPTAVPEPGTLTLLLAGLVACLARRRR